LSQKSHYQVEKLCEEGAPMERQVPTVKEVFDQAHEIETPVERQAYLDRMCGGSSELRHKVESLLRAYEEAGSFLIKPARAEPMTGEHVPEPELSERPTKVGPDTTDHRPADNDAGQEDGPGTQIGPYRLVAKLGEGGMGSVYLAEQEKPIRRQVALKIIKSGMDSAHVIARFEAERQALTMMDHPNIAKVFDAGTIADRILQIADSKSEISNLQSEIGSGRPYFVMELVRGVPITRFCDKGRLTVRERLELFVLVCQALQHAHQKGVMHRDIKPSNVLVADQDGKPAPKVIDFGLAKATEQALTEQPLATQVGSIMGTLEYMSPEQADFSARGVDTRTDVYALGVLLYELLTGTTPLESARLRAGGLIDAVMMINQEVPPTPSQRASSLGPQSAIATDRRTEPARLPKLLRGELDWIVMKALEKQRERRYQTAVDFARDVERYLADEPVEAGPPSARYRLAKFVRRNRVPVSLLSVAGTALVALVVVLFVSNQKVSAALDKANVALDEKTRAQQQTYGALRLSDGLVGVLTPKQAEYGEEERAALDRSLTAYEKYALSLGVSTEAREVAAGAQYRAANLRDILGDKGRAEAGYLTSIALYRSLAADFPENATYLFDMSLAQVGLANALRDLGRLGEARTVCQQAVDATSRNSSRSARSQEVLAAGLSTLGLVLCDLAESALGEQRKKELRLEALAALQQEIALWQEISAESPARHEHRYHLALGHVTLMLALNGLGRVNEAEDAYRKARTYLDKLRSESGTDPYAQFLSALAERNYGNILISRSQWAEGENAYRKAIDLLAELTRTRAAIPDYWSELGKAHFNLGYRFLSEGKWKEAESVYRDALIALKKAASASPTVPRYQIDLANGYNNMGVLLKELSRPVEAKEACDLAIKLQMSFKEQYPAVGEYQIGLAGTYHNLGNLVRDQNKPRESLEWYEKAIALLEVQDPSLDNASLFLRNASWDRANALGQLGKHAEAIKDWQRAFDLDDGAARENIQAFKLTAEMEEKIKAAEKSPARASASLRFEAAQVYARALGAAVNATEQSLQKQYADRALALLQEIKDAGYFRAVKRIEPLRNHADFKPLQQDPRFQEFLKRLNGGT
jgi:serine/threonine protein kinase